ncbi:hypothetical protein PIB30_039219 [Stylosanthes scabra]|uniref:Uncharacterized protein n=1 Tax=Stylosanthes scabra TaxID=79078 RepID=A0ABU6RET4_9FABA|nr:hypothetical protein [Stylosanthes scabra]
MKEREGRTVFKCRGASRGRAMPIAWKRPQMGAQNVHKWARTGARPERRERAALPVTNPRAPSAGARTHQGHRADHGRADAPRRGRECAIQLGSFGRMWPSSLCGRAKAIPRAREACGRAIKMGRVRGGSSDEEFGNLRSCGRATRGRPHHFLVSTFFLCFSPFSHFFGG